MKLKKKVTLWLMLSMLCIMGYSQLIHASSNAPSDTLQSDSKYRVKDGWFKDSKNNRYYVRDGKFLTGIHTIGSYQYYFNQDGILTTGGVTVKGSRYYFRTKASGKIPVGSMMKSDWLKVGNHYYYFLKDGKRAVKLHKIDGKYYYFRPKKEGKNPAGSMRTGWFVTPKYRYYFSSKGVMQIGFKNIGKKRYYFNSRGQACIGTFVVDKKKYFAYRDGHLAIGWTNVNGNRYYMNSKGAVQTGWLTLSGKKYYFNSKGALQRNTWVDKDHYVGSDGAWIEGYKEEENKTFRWPLPSTWNTITSPFGDRESPGGIGSTNHKGIDITAPQGTKIYAVSAGTVVVKLPPSQSGGFGNWIQINHGGSLISEYAHLSSFASGISVGTKVKRGQVIGYVGSTGNSTGPHLHFGVLNKNVRVDPMKYLKKP